MNLPYNFLVIKVYCSLKGKIIFCRMKIHEKTGVYKLGSLDKDHQKLRKKLATLTYQVDNEGDRTTTKNQNWFWFWSFFQ